MDRLWLARRREFHQREGSECLAYEFPAMNCATMSTSRARMTRWVGPVAVRYIQIDGGRQTVRLQLMFDLDAIGRFTSLRPNSRRTTPAHHSGPKQQRRPRCPSAAEGWPT